VMSTHGIGATGRHALGSVAMRVLQESDCPVLMVRIPVSSSSSP
jgi:nucleotide-binding universal stress UspA family protein